MSSNTFGKSKAGSAIRASTTKQGKYRYKQYKVKHDSINGIINPLTLNGH